MSGLSEQDWELVNAYHDGALSDSQARAFDERLATEPELATALASVQEISQSLSALRPALTTATAPEVVVSANTNRRPRRWLVGGVLAAALAVAMFWGAQQTDTPTAFDLHHDLAGQNFAVAFPDLQRATAQDLYGAPDLASANLTPVAFKAVQDGSVTHYAGRNGCRLSYFLGAAADDTGPLPAEVQSITWTTAPGTRHMIIATGMDRAKFDAIAAFLKLATGLDANKGAVASLNEATAAASPCVG